jgi:uncharacterized Zn-finger protein
VLTGEEKPVHVKMDAVGNLSSQSDVKQEDNGPDSHTDNNTQLAVNEALIKQEQDIVISSYGSIVGYSQKSEVSNATTITVTDGYVQETIEIMDPVNIKMEISGNSGIENLKLEEPVKIENEAIVDYVDSTIKKEETADEETEVIINSDKGIWRNEVQKSEIDMLPETDNYADTLKQVKEPNFDVIAPEQNISGYKIFNEKGYSCTVCGKSFVKESNLARHNLSHSGEKPHSCKVCGKLFAQKSHLKTHEVVHTGDKPHSCTVCGKSFARKGDLKSHEVFHTGEKSHSCTVCGKSFARKSDLTKHELLHTGEKPHPCSVCGKSFARKSNLTKHELLHTG